MIDYSKLTQYISLITTLLAAYLTYFFGYRKGKINQFYSKLEENINDILSPMFHDIRRINREDSSFKREALLKDFFSKYGDDNTNLHKIGDRAILDLYYSAEDLFYNFIKKKTNETWNEFWAKFHKLSDEIRDEYNTSHDIIYSTYAWMKSINEKNYLLRLILEAFAFLYETVKFLVTTGYLLLVPIIFEYKKDKDLFTIEFIRVYLSLLCILSMLFYLLVMCSSDYTRLKKKQKRKSDLRKLLERKFPKIIAFSNKFLEVDSNNMNTDIEIPEMYEN